MDNFIKSNMETAQSIATSIASSLDELSRGGVVTSDSQTTISGNTNAGEAIQAMSDAQSYVLQAVGQASKNLQSVASEFEAADKTARDAMTNLIPSLSGRKI